MKKVFLSLAVVTFLATSFTSCREQTAGAEDSGVEQMEPSEPSDMDSNGVTDPTQNTEQGGTDDI